MKTYKADRDGLYLVMSQPETRTLSIHASERLKKGDRLPYPDDAYVLLVVRRPEDED